MVEERPGPRGLLPAFVLISTALAALQVLTLGLSAAHVTITRPVAAVILIVSLLTGWLFSRRFPGERPHVDPPRAERWLAGLALVFALLVLGVAAVLTWQRPVYDWDGLYYHVPAIHGWAEAGRVAWIHDSPDVPFVNGYPMAVETTSFVVARLLGSSRWLDAGNLFFWPLAFLGVAVTATALFASRPWAVFAGSGVVLAPMFVSESLTAYVDPAFAAAVCGTFGATAWLLRVGPRRRWAILLGVQLGLLVGTKGLGVPFVVVTSFVVLVLGRHHGVGAMLRGLGLAATVALAIAGFWFVRNVIETGNPIHPIQLALFGRVWFEGYDHRAATLGNLPAYLAGVPEPLRTLKSWLQPDAPILDYGAVGGLGYVWLLGGLPALLAGLWVGRRDRVWVLLVALTVLFLLSQPATWWARFTLWLAAAGLPALGVGLCWLAEQRQRLALFLGLVFLGIGATETSLLLRSEWGRGREADGYVSTARFYFRGLEEEAPGLMEARHVARSDWSRLGVLLGGALAHDLERRIDWLPRTLTAEDVQALRARGVEWVIWDRVRVGEVPETLATGARDIRSFARPPDVDFVLIQP